MTFLALDPSESCTPRASYEGPVSANTAPTTALPRFNLRKRSGSIDRPKTNLSTVNSAFLSGLFADVAKVQDEIPEDSEPLFNQSLPNKKSRSMSRCGKSMMNVRDALVSPPSSPVSSSPDTSLSFSSTDLERKDSLLFQLSCVSSTSSNASCWVPSSSTTKTTVDAATLDFPHLPATISASSCNTLTRNLSDLQSFTTENSQKESYGWFVEMEEEDSSPTSATKPLYASTSLAELAFQAPTAPKASNHHDAEVAWAKAADTVDDVLGDFF
jgi:hypothetical protein